MEPHNPNNRPIAVAPPQSHEETEAWIKNPDFKLPAADRGLPLAATKSSVAPPPPAAPLVISSESGNRILPLRLSTPSSAEHQGTKTTPTTIRLPRSSQAYGQLPGPIEIKAHLDTRVHGQENAKKALVGAVYQHYLNLHNAEVAQSTTLKTRPNHILIVGPTGTGKTELVRTLSQYLDVPVLFCNAASISAEGYVGDSVSDVLHRYAKLCDNDPAKMERGIIFLDEFDKLRSNNQALDVRGQMAQQELLSLLDGGIAERAESSSKSAFHVDTRKVLVIAAGAFAELTNPNPECGESLNRNAVAQITPRDIEKYGFSRELVARFPSITKLDPLKLSDLVAIMKDPAKSPLAETITFFRVHGIAVEVTDQALNELAQQALDAGLGARGLPQLLNKFLGDLTWQVTDLNRAGIKRIRIDEHVVQGKSLPVAELRNSGERAPALPSIPKKQSAPKTEETPWAAYIIPRIESMSDQDVTERLLHIKHAILAPSQFSWKKPFATYRSKKLANQWWSDFEKNLQPRVFLGFAEELLNRNTTIAEFAEFHGRLERKSGLTLYDMLIKFDQYKASQKKKEN